MKLKAHYDPATLGEGKTPRQTHVEVIHTGLSPEQNFDDGMIERAVSEGWVTIDGKSLTMKTDGEPLRYTIDRAPGYFCKSTGEAIPVTGSAWARFRYAGDSSNSQPEARAWLAANGKESNDYDIAVAYHCTLDAGQHEHFRAVIGPKGMIVAAHTLQGA